MAPHFLIALHLQQGSPLWPLVEVGEWREEQQRLPGHQGRAEPLQQRYHGLLWPFLCGIHKKKLHSQRSKKKMTIQVFSGTPAQNTKSLNSSVCNFLTQHGAWSGHLDIKNNVGSCMLIVSSVFVCLTSRTRCECEQWAGGICSVLGDCPSTADRHRGSGSQTGTSSSNGQRNKILHLNVKCKEYLYAFNGYINDLILTQLHEDTKHADPDRKRK